MIKNIFKRNFCIRFTATHEWVKKIGNNKARIGITHHAREELGEIVFVDQSIINDGDAVQSQGEIATLESVKAAAPVYSPISAKVTAKNKDVLVGINKDSENEGWIIEVELTSPEEFNSLLKLDDYKALL